MFKEIPFSSIFFCKFGSLNNLLVQMRGPDCVLVCLLKPLTPLSILKAAEKYC